MDWTALSGTISTSGVSIERAAPDFFEGRFPKGHQGIAAKVGAKAFIGLDGLLGVPEQRGELPFFVVLDSIEDPRNLGAILRSADAAGVHGVVLQTHRSAGIGPEVSKSSAGALEHLAISMLPNIKHAIDPMKEQGITIVGAEAGSAVSLWQSDLTGPVCVVIGSEGQGMRATVRDRCDIVVGLPMRGRVNSLNASVACGIILFEVLRQRTAA